MPRSTDDMMRLPIFVLTAAASGAMTGGRLRDQVPIARNFLFGVFEWFGELGLFCIRLIRAALTPPYEFGELLRQCGVDVPIEEISAAIWTRASAAPVWAVLEPTPLPGGEPLRPWQSALADYVPSLLRLGPAATR